MSWILYTGDRFSVGGKLLSQKLGIPYSKNLRRNSKIINWGSTNLNDSEVMINKPSAVRRAVNKRHAFLFFRDAGVPHVLFTITQGVAKEWVESGNIVYARENIISSQGNGIKVITSMNEFIEAPLYTLGIKNPKEYRVHIFRNNVIDATQKLRRNGIDVNEYIRNSGGGWVFARNDIVIPKSVIIASKAAVKSLGLDFGAVDILLKDSKCYVLEVNTSPGIEGTTLDKYTRTFRKVIYA